MNDVIEGNPSAHAPTPAELAADPSLMDRHTNFGPETATQELEDRDFCIGEEVRIDKDAIVQDKERRQEGWTDKEFNDEGKPNANYLPVDKRPAIECNTKGMKGVLANGAYWSEEKQCMMAPVEVGPDCFVYVDERKLERVTPRASFGADPKMTEDDRRLARQFTKYQSAQLAARMEKLAFPTFTDWLALQTPQEV